MKPILYSFRRCPYAMRARLAIAYSGIEVEQREIELKNKPQAMLKASPKGTVPVLILEDGTVIDESLNIMLWALKQNNPQNWGRDKPSLNLIQDNDGTFKQALDHYKYAVRFPEHPTSFYREQGEIFLSKLEHLLHQHDYLNGNQPCLADYAIFPFVRQFAFVDKAWFDQAPYPRLQNWLTVHLQSTIFKKIMLKHATWNPTGSFIEDSM
ncbi:MAG: glutathione S-transferase [Ghiorsea sp.]